MTKRARITTDRGGDTERAVQHAQGASSTVTRMEAADILRVSKTGVRMFERDGSLHRVRGPRGEFRFDRREVEQLAYARARQDSTAVQLDLVRKQARAFTPEQFKAAALKIREGKAPLDIVVEVEGLTPDGFFACVEATSACRARSSSRRSRRLRSKGLFTAGTTSSRAFRVFETMPIGRRTGS